MKTTTSLIKRSVASLLLLAVLAWASDARRLQTNGYGPEVKSFLEYIRHEQVELNFQIQHNEISRKDFIRSKNRLEVQKQAVLTRVQQPPKDTLPPYTAMAADELR